MGFRGRKDYPREDPKAATMPIYSISRGDHQTPEEGMNIMEAVSQAAGEEFSSYPESASPVLAAFLRAFNDDCSEDSRVRLEQYIPRLVGSAGTKAQEEERVWKMLNWLVRGHLFYWCGLLPPALAVGPLGVIKGSQNLNRDNVGFWPEELRMWYKAALDYEMTHTTMRDTVHESETTMLILQRTGVYASGEYRVGATIEGVEKAQLWDQTHGSTQHFISGIIRIAIRTDKMSQLNKVREALENSVFKMLETLLAVTA